MTHPDRKFAALIGSRICHDLISPIGAINNGLELISLDGATGGPEFALISDSAADADARVRFFRLAFGMGGGEAAMRSEDVGALLDGVYSGTIRVHWAIPEPLPRPVVQASMLALMCAEDVIPAGGTLTVEGDASAITVTAAGARPNRREQLWALLTGAAAPPDLPPAHVQFVLLPALLSEIGRGARTGFTRDGAWVTF